MILGLAFMYLAVPSQVGHDRKVAAAAFDFASKRLLASVAVHVGLQRARTGESLVADLALVLLLRARRHLGAELPHHGLRRRGNVRAHERARSRQCSGMGQVDRLRGGAVVCDRALTAIVVAVVAGS